MKAMRFLALSLLVMISGSTLYADGNASAEAMENNAELSTYLQDTDPRYGEDSVQCVRNWSLYAEYYRQRNYEMAFEPWKYMFEDCPKATINIYIHGANMLKHFYNETEDPDRRDQLVDSLMMLYDQRIEKFGERGRVLGRKAADLYQLRPNDIPKLFELTEESIELRGMNSGADVLLINFQSVIRLVESGQKDMDAILERFERNMEIIEYNLEHNPEDERFYRPAKNNIEAMFEPYATCESLTALYKPRFEESPEDIELMEQIIEMMDNAGCRDDEFFFEVNEQLYTLQPDADLAFLLARLESDRSNYRESISYFQDAIDKYKEDDPEEHQENIFRSYWQMAEISYRRLENMPTARRYAREANNVSPNDGRPLILIGEMYAASASDCGDDEFTETTAYWVAVDKFERAANVAEDPSVQSRASELANTYRQYFPDGEIIFFHGYDIGETYRVECWINRDTRVRAR